MSIANSLEYEGHFQEFNISPEEYKTHVNDLLFQSGDVLNGVDDQVCMFQKPYKQCGSTTLIMNYLKNRMIYEENYEAIVIVKDDNELEVLRNIISSFENIIYNETTNTASNPNMNNTIYTTYVSSFITYSIQPTEIILLDYKDDLYSKDYLNFIFSFLNNDKEKTRLIVEYAPERL